MEMGQNQDNHQELQESPLPDLPHDLICVEILSRLPVESLYRFRTVCKPWNSVPDDCKFTELRQWRSLHAPHGIAMTYEYVEEYGHALLCFYSIDISEIGEVTKLLFPVRVGVDFYSMSPSLHGLVCFSGVVNNRIYVCNPSTHEILQLPKVEFENARVEVAGFGYDDYDGTYNVLCVCLDDNYLTKNWYILSLGSVNDGWMWINPVPHYRIQPRHNAYLNEAVYWISWGTPDRNRSGPDGLLYFDFFDKKFRVRGLPNCPSWRLYLETQHDRVTMHLKVMRNQLRIITTSDASESGYWQVSCWTMKDDVEFEWNFDFVCRINAFNSDLKQCLLDPVDIRDGEVYFSSGSKLYRHNLEKDVTKEMNDGIPGEDGDIFKSYQPNYSQSSTLITHSHCLKEMWNDINYA